MVPLWRPLKVCSPGRAARRPPASLCGQVVGVGRVLRCSGHPSLSPLPSSTQHRLALLAQNRACGAIETILLSPQVVK